MMVVNDRMRENRDKNRKARIDAWISELPTLLKMWEEGAFGEPYYLRDHPSKSNTIFLKTSGLEEPGTTPAALWIGPVVEKTTPAIIYREDKFYLHVFAKPIDGFFMVNRKEIRIERDTLAPLPTLPEVKCSADSKT